MSGWAQYLVVIPPGETRSQAGGLRDLAPRARALRATVWTLQTVVAVGALVGAYALMPVHERALLPIWMSVIVTLLVLVGATLYARWAVGRSDLPMLRAAQSIAFVVTFTVIGFAAVYASLSYLDESAFSERLDRIGALYLSVVTATTVGFGDIHARSDAARVVVIVQIVMSVGLLGLAIQMIRSAAVREVGDAEV